MAEDHEIRYEHLLNRLADDLQPVRPLWPVGRRLSLWIALEAAIIALTAALMGPAGVVAAFAGPGLLVVTAFMLVSVMAADLALKGAIPGRDFSFPELAILALVGSVGVGAAYAQSSGQDATFWGLNGTGLARALYVLGWSVLPWLGLFTAVRRGVVLSCATTGALAGLAALAGGIGLDRFQSQWSGVPFPIGGLLWLGTLLVLASAGAGMIWLDPAELWQGTAAGFRRSTTARFNFSPLYPLALVAATAVLIISLVTTRDNFVADADFDLAIKSYEQSRNRFEPNVPSDSIAAVLTAYIDHGMPPYMWDFSPSGYKLIGGRLEKSPDGTPLSLTWFRKDRVGIMCLLKTSDGFNPPGAAHDDRRNFLFYRYRGFSVCLINLGNYGSFVSVIVSPMPIGKFEQLVLDSVR